MERQERLPSSLLGRRVVPAVATLVVLSFLSMAGLLVQIALHLDEREATQTASFASAALARRLDINGREVKDYAAWGEAYEHLHIKPDVDWAFEHGNIGPTLYTELSYDYVFVVGPQGSVTYAMVGGELSPTFRSSAIEGGLDLLVQKARAVEAGETRPMTGFLKANGVWLAAAAAVVTTGGDPTIPATTGPQSVLVFADALTQLRLDELGSAAFVRDLRIAPADASPGADDSMIRTTVDGTIPIRFRWDPAHSGRNLLLEVLPWLVIAGCGFALLAMLILRRMMHAARLIESKAVALAEAHRLADYAAHHDSVTGLPNRLMLLRDFERSQTRPGTGGSGAMLFIDLDRFKPINDALGHQAGDMVLQQTARRLETALHDGDIAARVGGDEFVLGLRRECRVQDIDRLCRHLLDLIRRPMRIDGHVVAVGLSIGVAITTTEVHNAAEMMRRADLAMYRAKSDGGNVYRLFDDRLDAPKDAAWPHSIVAEPVTPERLSAAPPRRWPHIVSSSP